MGVLTGREHGDALALERHQAREDRIVAVCDRAAATIADELAMLRGTLRTLERRLRLGGGAELDGLAGQVRRAKEGDPMYPFAVWLEERIQDEVRPAIEP